MKIEEGYTLDFLIHGFFAGLTGIFLIYFDLIDYFRDESGFVESINVLQFLSGLFLILVSVLFFMVKSGIEISTEKRRVRVYKSLLKFNIGKWHQVDEIDQAYLKITKDSKEMMSLRQARTHTYINYDLYLVMKDNSQFVFHSFSKRRLGIKTLNLLHKSFKIAVEDRTRKKVN
jgi:hypothetical protein